MNQCQLIIEDEVNCKLVGLDLNTRKACSTALKYFIPAARYSAAYKLGRWDGTKSFMTIGGRTYLNLLEVVLPIIQEAGYELDIVDQRKSYSIALTPIDTAYHSNKTWPAGHRFEGQPIELRDYQVDVINSCVNNLQGVAVAPTSAGKTIIISTLSQMIEPYGRSIVIVPNKNLVLQTEEDYVNLGLDVGVIFGDRKEYTDKHTICTWQSLNVLDKKGKDALDEGQLEEFMQDQICVIVDECHKSSADILVGLLTGVFANIPIRWGLTGTLPKQEQDRMSILASVGPTVGQLTAKELQDQGYLAQCHVNVIQTQETVKYKDYATELKYLTTDDTRLAWLAATIQNIAKTGNTLVLVDRIASGKKLNELIPDSTFVSGEMKTADRKEHYSDINLAENGILIASYGTTSTGISINRIFNLVLVEPGKSFVRTIQSIGRGLRKANDKDRVEIYDVSSKCKYSQKHLKARIEFYKEAEYPHSMTKVTY